MKRNGMGFLMIILLLVLVGCSNNKKGIDDTLFKDGEKLLQAFYEALDGADKSKEIQELSPKFEKWEEEGTFSDYDEDIFVREIRLLEKGYQLYLTEYVLEYASGNTQGDAQGAKEEVLHHMKALEEEFGVKYQKK